MSRSPAAARQLAAIAAGTLAVPVAIWLVPASVHIVAWSEAGPARIGLFASRASLTWLLAGGLAAAAALAVWGVRSDRLAGLADRIAPLNLLWLWVVPFLPWLPDRVPFVLLLAGPARWIVAAVSLGAVFRVERLLGPARVRLRVAPGRRAVFAASLLVYAAFGILSARTIGPGGDEPHYLVITQSLLLDRDLRIENNHVRGDYRAYYGGALAPHYMRRGIDGEIYSIHAPGLPLLLAPAYSMAGYTGVILLLSAISALAAMAIFDLAFAIAGPAAAAITWVAVCLTVPFVPHGWLIFPEVPATLIIAWAALWLWKPAAQSAATWLWRGTVLATLPWLHTKFIVFLVLLGPALLVRTWRRPRAAAAFSMPIAVSIAAWLGFFYAIYGSVNPEAPYGDYPRINVLMRNVPRGLLGLFFDQKFGLLIYGPIYAFAIAGCWTMLRRSDLRWLAAALLLVIAAHVGSTTRLYMWWGGSSAPARFLVPILPCLAPMIAVAAAELRSAAWRALLWAALAVSVAVAAAGVGWPQRLLLFSDPHGRARLLELVEGAAPLTYLMPTFTEENWRRPFAELAAWLAAAALAWCAVAFVRRRMNMRSAVWLGTIGGLTFLIPVGLLASSLSPASREAAAHGGIRDLLFRYDAQRLRAVDYSRFRRLDERGVLDSSVTMVNRPRLAAAAPQRIIAGPFTLPPGSYEARVWFADTRPREGEIRVSSSDRAVFGRSSGPFGNPAIVAFQLPVAMGRLTVDALTPAIAAAAVRVELAPKAVVPPHLRDSAPVRAVESIDGHPGAFIVYVNEHTYPEGGVFWTRGTGAGSVLVSAPGASRLILTLHTGPQPREVNVAVAGVERQVSIDAGATVDLPVAVPQGLRLIPVTVQSSGFFRPAEIDPSSTDNRGLGCQVRITVE
jgi:hypothetical protein